MTQPWQGESAGIGSCMYVSTISDWLRDQSWLCTDSTRLWVTGSNAMPLQERRWWPTSWATEAKGRFKGAGLVFGEMLRDGSSRGALRWRKAATAHSMACHGCLEIWTVGSWVRRLRWIPREWMEDPSAVAGGDKDGWVSEDRWAAAKPKWSSFLVLVCLTAIPTLDSCYPRRQAVSLREVAIGGLTAVDGWQYMRSWLYNEYLVVIQAARHTKGVTTLL